MTFLESSAWGHGLATIATDGTILDVLYPNPVLGDAPKTDALWVVPKELDAMVVAFRFLGTKAQTPVALVKLERAGYRNQKAIERLLDHYRK